MSSVSFDFRKPTQTAKKSFQDVLDKSEQRSTNVKRDTNISYSNQASAQYTPLVKTSKLPWVLVTVLTLGLIAMSTLALFQNDYFESLNDSLPNRSNVAGVREGNDTVPFVISGDSFSIINSKIIPSEYLVYRDSQNIALFTDQNFRSNAILFNQTVGEQTKRNGILVEVRESDNKESQESFAQNIALELQAILGNQVVVGDLYIETANNSKLARLLVEGVNDREFYTSVTNENYYIITLFKQLETNDNLEEQNNFNKSIIPSLHLN